MIILLILIVIILLAPGLLLWMPLAILNSEVFSFLLFVGGGLVLGLAVIYAALRACGWSAEEIDDAVKQAQQHNEE